MIKLYERGCTDAQVARIVGVTRQTIDNWKIEYPDFFVALKEAKEFVDARVEKALLSRALGGKFRERRASFDKYGEMHAVDDHKYLPPDPTSAIFWLKNRQRDRWRVSENDPNIMVPGNPKDNSNLSFHDFCINAGYPAPFPKQIEMQEFGMSGEDAKLILGSRGYGKTEYVVILGVAFDLYKRPTESTTLLMTKSKERNAAMLREIRAAAEKNGVIFDLANATSLRVQGLQGPNHSVSAVTIKTVTLRGRHPKRVIMDDPVTPDDISEATRAHVERIYAEVHKLCSNILIIGQPVHKYDLYSNIRDKLKKMEVPHGTIPELDHDLEAQRLAGVDEESIQASYHLKVVGEGTTPFDNIKYIEKMIPGDGVAFVDPSFEGGDYTAVTILKGYMGGVAIVGFTFKKAWNHCLDDIVAKLNAHNVKKLCFETNSLGDQPVIMLRELFGGGVMGRKSNGNKHSRIMAAGAYAHRIHLSKESDRQYLEQVVKYEYKAKHDDAPDSLASCLEWVGLLRGKM